MQPVPITPKVFETLLFLVRHSGDVVLKDDLMKNLWPDAFVEESNLSQSIFMLRKGLGDTSVDRRYIVTVPGRGYRSTSDVQVVREEVQELPGEDHQPAEMEAPRTERRYAHAVNTSPSTQSAWRLSSGRRIAVVAAIGLAALGANLFAPWRHSVALRATDPVLIADFGNATGDPVFDDTLRQGLVVQLEQSPFLSLMPDERVLHTLQLMGQAAGTTLTPELGREVCTRSGGGAVLDGSIKRLGNDYVLGLRALRCKDGAILDEEQVQARRKEDVLDALTQIASRFRTRVGESVATVQEHDTALVEATTPSLEALKAYSTGRRLIASKGDAALPFFERAIALDPHFAMAYAYIGRIEGDLGEAELSAGNTRKAYELREHISDPERFWVVSAYNMQVTENLERAQQTCELWEQTYPEDPTPKSFLAGVIYSVLGR